MGPFDQYRSPTGGLRFYPSGRPGMGQNYWQVAGQDPQGLYGQTIAPTTFHTSPFDVPNLPGVFQNPTLADVAAQQRPFGGLGSFGWRETDGGANPGENDLGPAGTGPVGTHNPDAFDPNRSPLDVLGGLPPSPTPFGVAGFIGKGVMDMVSEMAGNPAHNAVGLMSLLGYHLDNYANDPGGDEGLGAGGGGLGGLGGGSTAHEEAGAGSPHGNEDPGGLGGLGGGEGPGSDPGQQGDDDDQDG